MVRECLRCYGRVPNQSSEERVCLDRRYTDKGANKGNAGRDPTSEPLLGFDKDEAGRGFVKNFKAIAKEMGFADFTVQAFHPWDNTKTGTMPCLANETNG